MRLVQPADRGSGAAAIVGVLQVLAEDPLGIVAILAEAEAPRRRGLERTIRRACGIAHHLTGRLVVVGEAPRSRSSLGRTGIVIGSAMLFWEVAQEAQRSLMQPFQFYERVLRVVHAAGVSLDHADRALRLAYEAVPSFELGRDLLEPSRTRLTMLTLREGEPTGAHDPAAPPDPAASPRRAAVGGVTPDPRGLTSARHEA